MGYSVTGNSIANLSTNIRIVRFLGIHRNWPAVSLTLFSGIEFKVGYGLNGPKAA